MKKLIQPILIILLSIMVVTLLLRENHCDIKLAGIKNTLEQQGLIKGDSVIIYLEVYRENKYLYNTSFHEIYP